MFLKVLTPNTFSNIDALDSDMTKIGSPVEHQEVNPPKKS